jgi:sigma-B regulation protein RsbU (phosphoserine phosphatase)
MVNDFQKESQFYKATAETVPIHSLLSVPLISKGRMIGLISIFNKKMKEGFDADDQRLLTIIAAQSAQVIENARLLEEEQALLKIQEELRLAFEIQNNLLPQSAPKIQNYDISGKSLPAREVGGDYFDFIQLESDQLAFCLGDVSGKGLPAALLMSNLQATIRGQTLVHNSPAECLNRSNTILFHNTAPEKFATFFYGILDIKNHRLRYTNAGHNYPYIFSKERGVKELKSGGVVLGCLQVADFSEEIVDFQAGDLLVIYSDGITEATNTEEEEFGEIRLTEVILDNLEKPTDDLIRLILGAVESFSENSTQTDDMTLMAIRRLKES